MNLTKLNPWNWFKHEDNETNAAVQIPLSRDKTTPAVSNMVAQNNSSAGNSLLRLHQQMDQLFDDVWNSAGFTAPLSMQRQNSTMAASNYLPQLDISGDEKNYEINLNVPGLSETDINIEVNDDVLTITGNKVEKNETKDKQFYRIERSYGSFKRTLSLPDDVKVDEISAALKEGILTLNMPRSEQPKKDVRRINITS